MVKSDDWKDFHSPEALASQRALQERVNQNIRDLAAVTRVPTVIVEDTVTTLKLRPGDQPLPVVNDEPDVQSQVIADIAERRQLGISRYGTALQPFNGRDALRDAYEEAIDLAMYLKQWLIERDRLLARVKELEEAVAQVNATHCGCISDVRL